jgi:hypothetical protein
MVSDASPGIADPKMNGSFVHTVQTSLERRYSQDGYLRRPHRTIIDGDMWSDSGWIFGWIWGCEAPNTRLVRRKLGKNKHTPTMAATLVLRPPWCPTPRAETINNQPIYYATS